MADTKTLDEHAETVKRLDAVDARLAEVFGPRPESVRAVRDAYEAERAARVAARAALQGVADVVDPNGDHYFWRKKEADLAGTVKSIMEDRERIDAEWRKRAQLGMCVMDAPNGPECWCGAPSEVEAGLCLHHARELERLSHAEKAEARVRELEAERDALVKAHAIRERVFNACAKAELQQRTIDLPAWRTRADKAEADLAETRAQLARLREAAEATERLFSYSDSMQQFVLPANARVIPALGALRDALSTPGPRPQP